MTTIPLPPANTIVYPESDGNPIADNTLQFRWIVTIQGGLDTQFAANVDVFVAGDLLWYPLEGDNRTRVAPDILVAFGRPKGDRGSYLQWREDNIAPQVVWEILSPGNRTGEMSRKFAFYDRFGVEEYYLYDPDRFHLTGWTRRAPNDRLRLIEQIDGWISPRLGIRFETPESGAMRLYHPDGEPFVSFVEVSEQRAAALRAWEQAEAERRLAERQAQVAEKAQAQAETRRRLAESEREWAEAQKQAADRDRARAEAERRRAEAEKHQAEMARVHAETARVKAETENVELQIARMQAETERYRAETAQLQAEADRDAERAARERLETRLRALGIDPDAA